VGAVRHAERAALLDDRGTVTFREMHQRTQAIASALRSAGVGPGDTFAIICRNHRGLVEATVAASTLAADIHYLSPAGPSSEVRRELRDAKLVVHDEEFAETIAPVSAGTMRCIASPHAGEPREHQTLDDLARGAGEEALKPPTPGAHGTVRLARPARAIGALLTLPGSLLTPGARCSRIPLKPRQTTMIAAPICEPWGYLHLTLGMRLASTLLLGGEFEPIATLAALERHRASAVALLPEMLARLVDLPRETAAWYSMALRVIAVHGPVLPSEIALPAIEMFGDILHNLAGPTVVQVNSNWRSHLAGGPIDPLTGAVAATAMRTV